MDETNVPFSYKLITFDLRTINYTEVEQVLNTLGQLAWELVDFNYVLGAQSAHDRLVFVFKRIKCQMCDEG